MLKEYKNGNLHIKLENDDTGISVIEKLYYNYDLYPVNDEYCISNYMTASDYCYNGGSNYYRITGYDLLKLEEGKTIILYPLDDDYINEYILNDNNDNME
ncbi:MAG: hypothetical protein ACI4VL_02320 [Bacilli bacterium]